MIPKANPLHLSASPRSAGFTGWLEGHVPRSRTAFRLSGLPVGRSPYPGKGYGLNPRSSNLCPQGWAYFRVRENLKAKNQNKLAAWASPGEVCAFGFPSPGLAGSFTGQAPRIAYQGPGKALKSSPVRCSPAAALRLRLPVSPLTLNPPQQQHPALVGADEKRTAGAKRSK